MQTATVPSSDVARALCAYAERFHQPIGDRHHIASPLGAWVLLALCAPGAQGRLRDELTSVLGVDVDAAAAFAGKLLAAPHPAVASGAGIWTRPGLPADGMSGWLAGLPAVVERGDVPARSALDAWAKARTLGLIDRFPTQLDPQTTLLLATALATKVKWRKPFETAPVERLSGEGAGDVDVGGRRSEKRAKRSTAGHPWSLRVDRVLMAVESEFHGQLIARTERAGDVAVHAAEAEGGLIVTSVIAERTVPPSDVLAVAHELAIALACGETIARRSLFDLPLGKSSLWTIEEREAPTSAPGAREEWCMAILPAWSARSQHSLADARLGFPAAAAALLKLAGVSDGGYVAAQSAIARYNRTGFEAATLGAVMAFGSLMADRRPYGLVRRGELRFGHPFAVVAVCAERPWGDRVGGRARIGPWHGLPVYSAWVTEPSEAEEADDRHGVRRRLRQREIVERPTGIEELLKRQRAREDTMS